MVDQLDGIVVGTVGYPRRLADLADPPEQLWARGVVRERPLAVAIVGARAASGHGMATARAVARDLAGEHGAAIVSGGAVGVDSAAHRGALDVGGYTIAVLAGGLDTPYPTRNRPLFGDVIAAGGAVVSQFRPGTPPRRANFVRRNRVMAALADAVVVIEAGMASGALHTAAFAREHRRVLGAVPGSPGCEALIAQGAAVVESAADVLAALAGSPRRPDVPLPAPQSDAGRVLATLELDAPRAEADIAACTGLGAREVSRALTGLELEGLAVLLPGRAYVRSCLAQELLSSAP